MLRIVLRLILVVLPCALTAQDSDPGPTARNLLQIASPTDGAVVSPGQTISVTVTSPASGAFSHVAVIGEATGFSSIATSLPAQFSLSIPTDISCRRYSLTAVGITASGQEISSQDVVIDVERSDPPTSLSTLMPEVVFDNLGEQFPIKILASFSDGRSFDVTESSRLSFDSSNSKVAIVAAGGMVTALGVGKASITATYGDHLHATIPITVPPQALDPSVSSLNFGSQWLGISSSPQQISLTNKTYSPMKIVALNITGDFAEKDNCRSLSPLPAGGTCAINVTFTPTEGGLRKGSVNISDSFNGTLTILLLGTSP